MAASAGDPALDVLFLPFDEGLVSWPSQGDALFLRARYGEPMQRRSRANLICEQSFAPQADALRGAGWTVRDVDASGDAEADTAQYPLVLVLPPRQREEARALLAHAVARCAPGGTVVACMANDEGAKSGESDLKALAGLSGTMSKHHCRVYWATIATATTDAALLATWSALDVPRLIADGRFYSRPGLFAWDRIDPASALLASMLPSDLCGRAADLGAGYGYLSAELLQRCPGIVALDLYEAEARALALAKRNLEAFSPRVTLGYHWKDVAAGLSQGYDIIVSNPPFHAHGRSDRPDIGRAFIAAAAQALNPGGRLWLVANRHLPYEQALDAGFASVRTVAQANGFKVVEAVKAAAGKALKMPKGRRA
jgi:16S rRNA (guanine1207-N2)-methyltransferase